MTWLSRVMSAVDHQRLFGQSDNELVAPGVDQRPAGFDGPSDDLGQIHPLPLQRDGPASDARDVQQVVDQPHEVLHLTLDDLARLHALRVGQLLEPQQMHGGPNRRQRVPDLVRQHRQELVLAPVGFPQRLFPIAEIRRDRLELRGPLGDALFELAIQPLELSRLAKQIHEDADLRPKNLRDDGNRHVVHGAAGVALEPVEFGQMDAGDEDDRRLLEPRVLAHHRRQLEPVELRHADIDQDHRHVGVEEMVERFAR